MKARITFILSLTTIITLAAGSAFGAYSGGTGEPNDPYRIADANDLLDLAGNTVDYGKCFILTADVNMEGQVFTTAIIAADTNSGGGFEGTAFTGTFDGNSHKITHFTINGGSNYFLGLFGFNSGGLVKNLGVENCSVSGGIYVSGLVGVNEGSISNCYSTGAVSGSSNSQYVGGLVGCSSGSISNCYSTGAVNVSSNSYCVGGLLGFHDTGIVSNCYSTGSVTVGSNSWRVGGLAGGGGGGSISNCYSTGAVNSDSNSQGVGGLIGVSGDNISNCYSTGAVNSGSNSQDVGGLMGWNDGSISSSFWDTQTSGQISSDGGEGKTTAEMKSLSTFTSTGWNFVDVWGIGNGQTYPYLKPLTGFNPADINYSGTVDFADFAILASHWLEGI